MYVGIFDLGMSFDGHDEGCAGLVVNAVLVKTLGCVHDGSEGYRRRMVDAEGVIQHCQLCKEMSSLAYDVTRLL